MPEGTSTEGAVQEIPEAAPPQVIPDYMEGLSDDLIEIVHELLQSDKGLFMRWRKTRAESLVAKIKFLEALVWSRGNITKAWAHLGKTKRESEHTHKNWCKNDPTFKDLYSVVVRNFRDEVVGRVAKDVPNPTRPRPRTAKPGSRHGKMSERQMAAAKPSTVKSYWRRRFVKAYMDTGYRTKAAKEVGIKLSDLKDMLDAASSSYDEELSSMVAEAELARLYDIEDKLLSSSMSDSANARFALQSLMRDKYKPENSGGSNNIFWMSSTQERAVGEMMKGMFGGRDATTSQVLEASLLTADVREHKELDVDTDGFDPEAFLSSVSPADG